MRKVLISPAHYLLDYTSRSEFYFAAKLIRDLALKTPDTEYYVLCGKCINEMPGNVKLYQLYTKDTDVELNLVTRIKFYLKLFICSCRLSWTNQFDIVWHFFPNGRFSFNPFIFFGIDRLLNPSVKRMVGRLQYSKHDINHHLDKFHLNSIRMHTIKPDCVTASLQKSLFKVLSIFSNYYFNLFDLIIFNNESAKNHYFDIIIKKYSKKIVIIPVAVDLEQFRFVKKTVSNKLELLFAGVLDDNKRVDEALRICAALEKEHVDFHLTIAGDGERRRRLEVLAKELLNSANYTFLGNVPKCNMPTLFQRAHFLFSLSQSESFGQVFAESWSSGTVFVGSDIPVYVEVIKHLENGIIYNVESKDYQLIAKTISFMNQQTYERITELAHKEVLKYDWNSVVEQYEQALERV